MRLIRFRIDVMVNIEDKRYQRRCFQTGQLENMLTTVWILPVQSANRTVQDYCFRQKYLILTQKYSFLLLQKTNNMAVWLLSCSCPKPILSDRIRATVVCRVANLPPLRCFCFSISTERCKRHDVVATGLPTDYGRLGVTPKNNIKEQTINS